MSTIIQYFYHTGKEFLQLPNYFIALLIGLVINFFTTGNPVQSMVPFIVPVIVQVLSKGTLKFKSRYAHYLLMLPGERKDPAFLINCEGDIIASAGRTQTYLNERKIHSMKDLFNDIYLDYHLEMIRNKPDAVYTVELFSQSFNRWYQTQFRLQKDDNMLLVWLEDISERKHQEQKLLRLRQFSRETTASVKELVKTRDTFERVAQFVLNEDYGSVFLARELEKNTLTGYVFKMKEGDLVRSDIINADRSSAAPIWNSRILSEVTWSEKESGQSQKDFEKDHPFHPDVKAFVDNNIINYINYHEGDLSLIAYNKKTHITRFEGPLIETLVNTARSITYLTDLAITNDERFVQSIQGLCAAAEFSDEQTGQHILRVNEYSRLIAGKLGCSETFQETIGQVAAIHDIGKVAIPEIIKLPRKLTADERSQMEMHTVFGGNILDQMLMLSSAPDTRLNMARTIAINHHQAWDGSGYPALIDKKGQWMDLSGKNRLKNNGLRPPAAGEIPLEALIVALSDTYDALRSTRHYKPEFSHEKAVKIINLDDRTGITGKDRFGPVLHELFRDIEKEFAEIYESMS